ncbi:phage tail tape measure protein [Chenggangzhangella methanolivorans]|uniref:Phage tail tape measure protein n=1 Tax=Chenggangzhangella methanolivorans TaxID=1437009 RepID=A0A9E6RCH2_9HYPH|nr:phage tail tape measure protein [Chenggangzhangella methanolivorans]QZO00774.1 phage tail tape measure protein [Chenggangzhangella methanolivorans]
MAEGEAIAVTIEVEASALRRELTEAERLSRRFGSALGDALEAGVVQGSSLSEVLRGLSARLSSIALSAALKPVETAFGSIFSGLTRGLFGGASPFGAAGLAAPQGVSTALASASPAAVAAPAPQSAPQAGHGAITVNISTPDAESFRRSEVQVSAALARAVARGRRGL